MGRRNSLKSRFRDRHIAKCISSLVLAASFLFIPIPDLSVSFAHENRGEAHAQSDHAPFDGHYVIHLSENARSRSAGRREPGYFDSLVIELFDKAGLQARLVDQMPWKRQLEEADHESGHVIYPMTRSQDRENSFKWVGPVSRTIWNLYGFAMHGWAERGFSNILEDARIGVLMGSARETYLRARGAQRLVIVPREELLLPMMRADRVDLIAIGGNVLRYYIDQANDEARGEDLPEIDGVVPYRSCYLYIAISGDVPDDDISGLQRQLDLFKTDGFFVENRRSHGLSANPENGFIRAMLDLGNNGLGCIDLSGLDE